MRFALLMLLWLLPSLSHGQAPRYYMVIRGVQGAPGVGKDDPVVKLARKIFQEELGKRPEIATQLSGLPTSDDALSKELKSRKLKGYQLTLNLLSVGRALNPPPRGKQYRVLERSVRLTVVGSTLPGEQLAVGGDGESTVQADVGAQIGEGKEQELLTDALHDAISQGVQQAVRKLDKGGVVPPPEKRRR